MHEFADIGRGSKVSSTWPRREGRALGRRLSVGGYLLVGFVIGIAAITALVTTASVQSFDRERAIAEADLSSAARYGAEYFVAAPDQLEQVLTGLASTPGVASLDPDKCDNALSSLRSALEGGLRVHVVDARGRQRCAIEDPAVGARSQPVGAWFDDALASDEMVLEDARIDPLTGKPAYEVAVAIPGPDGPRGVVLAVVDESVFPIELAPGTPTDTAVVALDARRRLVMATTADAPVAVGPLEDPDRYQDVRPGQVTTVEEADGESWLYTEVAIENLGWRALAGRPEDLALAPARAALRRMAMIGVASLVLMAGLGLVLQRRLARPVRRLREVVEESGRTGDFEPAPVSGPREIATFSLRFNELMEESAARELDLRWRATHDVLTGLPNRAALAEALAEILDDPGEPGCAVLFLDLDRFKLINDTHGHPLGDRLLVVLGRRLMSEVGTDGLVGRFGGDEFVVVSRAADDERAVRRLASRLIETVQRPMVIEGHDLYVSGCVGIAFSRPGEGADDVIRNADTAMYHAKSTGSGVAAVFDVSMRDSSVRRAGLESDLHEALARGELFLHYQPIVDIASGSITAFEALLRWNHPTRGVVPPSDFIPIAEESGLIIPIGEWVIEQAAARAGQWLELAGHPIQIAVNVAATQFSSPRLLPHLEATLAATALPARTLTIEVTESSLLQDPDAAADALRHIRALGVEVAVDDFGTGYSSLSYLQKLPIDILKVDRSFVSRLDIDGTSAKIVRSVVDLAHALDLTIVAEGVETAAQLQMLRGVGCDQAQGYLIMRPQPAEGIERLLRSEVNTTTGA